MIDDQNADAEAHTSEARNDPRATYEFVNIALTEPDEHAAWEAVTLLQFRGTREVFDTARHLCASECPQERAWGRTYSGSWESHIEPSPRSLSESCSKCWPSKPRMMSLMPPACTRPYTRSGCDSHARSVQEASERESAMRCHVCVSRLCGRIGNQGEN